MPFEIFFHGSKADLNCQLADYFDWAIAIKWERGERRSYILVKNKIKSEYEIFERGKAVYYSFKN